MSSGRERSAQEREAARLERQRRRTGGQDQVSPPPSPADPPAGSAGRLESSTDPTTPRPASIAPVATTQPESSEERYDEHTEDFESIDDGEAPVGTKRVSGLHRPRSRQPLRRSSSRAQRIPPGHARISRAGRAAAVVAIVLAIALIWFLAQLFQPFHGPGGRRIRVVIPPRLSSNQVGDLLARDGVISSSFFFELRATLAGERGSLRAGTYALRADMSYGDVLRTLTAVPPAARVTQLTVIEGQTRSRLNELLSSQGVHGSYLAQTRRSPLLSPTDYGAPQGVSSLEGFLFPSTYQLREPISIAALVADQLQTFRQRFAQVSLGYARDQHLTAYDVLIIASIIQGEARTAGDRALISSVIYNRLRAHMPLQMDDTVRYATGNYDMPITVSQLASASAWNTYTHAGLPPTPINNPGLAAMQAAAHPASTNYLFFVVKPCGNGSHAFASDYAEFQALQSRYNVARVQRGGRSPEFCR